MPKYYNLTHQTPLHSFSNHTSPTPHHLLPKSTFPSSPHTQIHIISIPIPSSTLSFPPFPPHPSPSSNSPTLTHPLEFKKAKEGLKEEKKVSESQKDTYAKMFNPDKRKEEQQKRKEEKETKKKNQTEEHEEDGFGKYLAWTVAIAGAGLLLYKVFKK